MSEEWAIVWTNDAVKDRKKLTQSQYAQKCRDLIDIIRKNPYQSPPAFERLLGDLDGMISRRINIQHRLVYDVLDAEHTVKILSCWEHYDG